MHIVKLYREYCNKLTKNIYLIIIVIKEKSRNYLKLFNKSGIAIFLDRPNRFIIIADLDGEKITCHCANTGRMGELLHKGVKLIIEKSDNPKRKTAYTVVAVFKGDLIVPITSVRANNVVKELIIPYLFNKPDIKSEVTYNKSRLDFLVKDNDDLTFIEVKSCTLFQGDLAIFPDAPTVRGVKHLNELEVSVNDGYKGMVILVVFNPGAKKFSPNSITDPIFTETFKRVSEVIRIVPFRISLDENGLTTIPDGDPILPIIYQGELDD